MQRRMYFCMHLRIWDTLIRTHIFIGQDIRDLFALYIYVMFVSALYILQMGLFLPLFMPSVKVVCLYQIGRHKRAASHL